jgi:hypothetical protein
MFAAPSAVTAAYGVGGDPPVRGILGWKDLKTTVDYPPMALYELGAAGRVYRCLPRAGQADPDAHDAAGHRRRRPRAPHDAGRAAAALAAALRPGLRPLFYAIAIANVAVLVWRGCILAREAANG